MQVVAALAPAAAVELGDARHQHLGLVRPRHPLLLAADRQLPAHLGLGLQRMTSGAQRQRVQRAAFALSGAWPIEEDARAVVRPGAAPVLFVPDVVDLDDVQLAVLLDRLRTQLPVIVGQLGGELAHPLLVGLVGEERAVAAATVRRAAGEDAVAAPAEDAGPARAEPCQIGTDDVIGIGRVDELHPFAGEVQADLPDAWLGYRGSCRHGREPTHRPCRIAYPRGASKAVSSATASPMSDHGDSSSRTARPLVGKSCSARSHTGESERRIAR